MLWLVNVPSIVTMNSIPRSFEILKPCTNSRRVSGPCHNVVFEPVFKQYDKCVNKVRVLSCPFPSGHQRLRRHKRGGRNHIRETTHGAMMLQFIFQEQRAPGVCSTYHLHGSNKLMRWLVSACKILSSAANFQSRRYRKCPRLAILSKSLKAWSG